MSWTRFLKFDSLFEIKHYVGFPGRDGDWKTSLEGKQGYLSMADGLSPRKGGAFDYNTLSKDQMPCGVYWIRIQGKKGYHSSGYFDYIGMASARGKYAAFQHGIFGRMFDHYRKIVQLPARSKIKGYMQKKYPSYTTDKAIFSEFSRQKFKSYAELREYFTDPVTKKSMIIKDIPNPFLELHEIYEGQFDTLESIQSFFSNSVSFRYWQYSSSSKTASNSIAKGEGLALREYFHKFGAYPYLNSREETGALEGFYDY